MQVFRILHVGLTVAILSGVAGSTAAERPPANVPPTWEIEVIDPNADSQGRPAVELSWDEYGNQIVDIPPALLVHRYYYSGDRSFQAQLLPGGPTIVVVNHPKTGERCYVNVQMPPGAPRVTYTGDGIEYDFGQTGVKLHFGLFGHPSVKYRSGLTVHQRVSQLFHVDEIKQKAATKKQHIAQTAGRTKKMAYGALVSVSDAADQVIMPVQNLLQTLPLGKVIFDPTRADQLIQTGEQHKLDRARKRAEKQQRIDEASQPTIR